MTEVEAAAAAAVTVKVRVVVYGEQTVELTNEEYWSYSDEPGGLADFVDRTADEIAPRRYLINPVGYVLDPFSLRAEMRAALNGPQLIDALTKVIRAALPDDSCQDCAAQGVCSEHIAVAIAQARVLDIGI